MTDEGGHNSEDLDPRLQDLIAGFLDLRATCGEGGEEFTRRVLELIGSCPAGIRPEFIDFLASEGVSAEVLDPRLPDGAKLSFSTSLVIREFHADGGMGRVYRAHDPRLGREVAVKVMRTISNGEWRDSAEDRDEFLAEASVTAKLGHPSVPAIYGCGSADANSGATYYAMKFVGGRRTLEQEIYDLHRGTDEDRNFSSSRSHQLLRHFQGVCNAVEKAHEKSIIHRDLKPVNIVIDTENNIACVIDWGLARPVDWGGQAEGSSSDTIYRKIVGTLPYMAPECALGQCSASEAGDIYSLGAVLYHILVGRPPFAPPPGRAPDTPNELHAKVIEGKCPPASAIRRSLPPRLERICRKAMAKAPEERFRSAGQLSGEIQRWFEHEPPLYVGEKTIERAVRYAIKKHPERLVTRGLAAAACLLTAVCLLWARDRVRAANAEKTAEVSRIKEAASTQVAAIYKQERDKSLAVTDFLVDDLLSAPVPWELGRNLTLVEALDRAAPKISQKFGRYPDSEARVRAALGTTYRYLGQYSKASVLAQEAVDIWERTLGHDDPSTLNATINLAGLLCEAGDLVKAEALMRSNLSDCQRVLKDTHPATMTAINNLGELLRDVAVQEGIRSSIGQKPKGPAREPQRIREEAESLLRSALGLRKAAFGEHSVEVIATKNNLGVLLDDCGRHAEAKELLAAAFADSLHLSGPEYPQTLAVKNNLASVRLSLGDIGNEAEFDAELRDNLAATERVMGEYHNYTITSLNNLVTWGLARGDWAEMVFFSRRRLLIYDRIGTVQASQRIFLKDTLARGLQEQGAHAEAEPMLRELVEQYRRMDLDPRAPVGLSNALAAHAWSLLELGRLDDVEKPLAEARERHITANGKDHRWAANAESLLGAFMTARKRYEEAEQLLKRSYPLIEQSAATPPQKARAMERFIKLYEAWGNSDQAAAWRAKRAAAGRTGTGAK